MVIFLNTYEEQFEVYDGHKCMLEPIRLKNLVEKLLLIAIHATRYTQPN